MYLLLMWFHLASLSQAGPGGMAWAGPAGSGGPTDETELGASMDANICRPDAPLVSPDHVLL
jgi:hypothetical protein